MSRIFYGLGGSAEGLRICDLNETVAEIFEISGFSTILRVFATEEESLQGF
jgi:anti-anti-sigma regulatory factor